MNRDQKAAVVEEIAEELKGSDAIFAVDYRGISVPQAAELRARLRDADATFRIVKNRLTVRAAAEAGTTGLDELLEGPTALTFVRGDAALAAKALNEFARANDVLDFKGGLMDGQAVTGDEIRSIARLPGRDVMYGQLVGMIAAPITGLVRGLSGLISGIAVQLQQIHDQGLVTGEAPAAEAPAEEPMPAEEAPGPADSPPAEETAPAEETPAEDETVTESSGDPVVEGETGSSAAGPEGEHPEEPAEGDPQADNETEPA